MTKKKSKKQQLEDSLSEAINPKPKVDRLNNVHSLLDSYRSAPKVDSEVSLDAQMFQLGRPISENSDAQEVNTGRPKVEGLDAKTPNLITQTKSLDAKTPKNKNLDAQSSKNWVKYESHRTTDRVNLRPSVEILQKAKVYAAENRLNLTELFELAVMNLIDLDAQNKSNLDAKTPLDDRRRRLLFKTNVRIINLWLEYNRILDAKSKWKPKDDVIGMTYNDADLRIVELGIIQTHNNYFQIENPIDPPRSFKYYTSEIEKVRTFTPPDILDNLLERHRKWWQEKTGKVIDYSFLDS
jgi:hypothetical protein